MKYLSIILLLWLCGCANKKHALVMPMEHSLDSNVKTVPPDTVVWFKDTLDADGNEYRSTQDRSYQQFILNPKDARHNDSIAKELYQNKDVGFDDGGGVLISTIDIPTNLNDKYSNVFIPDTAYIILKLK